MTRGQPPKLAVRSSTTTSPTKTSSCRQSSTTKPTPSSTTKRQADLCSLEELQAWRDSVIAEAKGTDAKGGCPLGSLGGQLAETDPEARALLAAGFERWSTAISEGPRVLHASGQLSSGIDLDDLAVTVLAALRGGLLLAQVQRDSRPLETTVDTLLALASSYSPRPAMCLASDLLATTRPARPYQ